MSLHHQHRRSSVLQHEGQPLPGVVRIQGYIGPSCLENREQALHHPQRTFSAQTHRDLRAYPQALQAVSQTGGAAVQLGIGQQSLFGNQRHRFRRQIHLSFEQLMQALRALPGPVCRIPLD